MEVREAYYSSDEEIAWGPLTLREIKKELQRTPKKIERRESDPAVYMNMQSPIQTKNENNILDASGTSQYFSPNQSLQADTVSTKNEVFLDKLSKVIDGEINKEVETSYASALDSTKYKSINDTLMKILSTDEEGYSDNLDNIHQTLVDNTLQFSPQVDQKFGQQHSIIQEISDESYCSDSDEIIVITDDSSDESVEHIYEPVEQLVKHERQSSVLPEKVSKEVEKKEEELEVINSDSSEDITDLLLELEQVREKRKQLAMDTEDIVKNEAWKNDHETRNIQTEDNICPESEVTEDLVPSKHEFSSSKCLEADIKLNDSFIEETTSLSIFGSNENQFTFDKPEEKKDNTYTLNSESVSASEQFELTENIKHMTFSEDNLNISGVNSLPSDQSGSEKCNKIKYLLATISSCTQNSNDTLENSFPSLTSTDQNISTGNVNKSESFVFNDTIEEMEMALKQGMNYNMPEISIQKVPEASTSSGEVEMSLKHGMNCNVPEISPQKEPETSTSSGEIIVTKTTVKKKPLKTPFKKFDYIQSPIGDYIRSQKSPDHFKPPKPPKSKLTPNQRSPVVQTKLFKGIVSPVGIYIKNSPQVCLKQNVQVKTVPSIEKYVTRTEVVTSNKENITTKMPEVIYKPAKKTVSSVKKEVNLPSSIQKLVPKTVLVKHEKRIHAKDVMNNTAVSRKLLEDDLTTTTVDGSLLGQSSDDISFVTKKQAFIS